MNSYTRNAADSIRYEDSKYKHLLGVTYGRLTAIRAYHRIEGRNSRLILVCKCKCGNLTHQRADEIKTGHITSCGCRHHGLSRTRLYFVWRDMLNRCYNKNIIAYKWYGGRGITVCDEWHYDFLTFVKWCAEHGYRQGLQIDRIDNDKGYSPGNCRFITPTENQRNTSRNRRITFQGETHPLVEWCEILHLNYHLIVSRLSNGKTFEQALEEPINLSQRRVLKRGADGKKHGRTIRYNGEEHTCLEWARIKGISWHTIQNRLRLGWDVDRIFNTPVRRFHRNEK